jgi:hypothetical protein
MNLDSELRSIPLEKLKVSISGKKAELQVHHEELLAKANEVGKRVEEYTLIENEVLKIQRYVNHPFKLLSLLESTVENVDMIQEMYSRIKLLSYDEIIKDGNVAEWVGRHDELYKTDKSKVDLPKQYENRSAIKNIEVYDATLRAMHNRRFSGDVFQTAINYLKTNDVVEGEFTIQNLMADFRCYEASNIIMTEQYWKVLKKAYINERDKVFLQESLLEIKNF